jgi:hypothetical protein
VKLCGFHERATIGIAFDKYGNLLSDRDCRGSLDNHIAESGLKSQGVIIGDRDREITSRVKRSYHI